MSKDYKKTHWTPVEDKSEAKAKVVKAPVKEKPAPAKLHGWTTPEQCVEMIDEMITWLKAGNHPCPFKRQ